MVDLHNHTKRCNHAIGEVDDYVKEAIKKGTKIFGFSDHAPMYFETEYRMAFDEMSDYESDIKKAKEKYDGKIDILFAYEVDYGKDFLDDRVLKADVDYFIGSVHFINGWGFDNPEYLAEYKTREPNRTWSEYFDAIAEMANSEHFQIVGHFDLLKLFNFFPTGDIVKLSLNALEAIKKNGMAIEINSAGLRKPVHEQYPSVGLLNAIREMNMPITFGSDSHTPNDVSSGFEHIKKLAIDAGFKEICYFRKKELFFTEID